MTQSSSPTTAKLTLWFSANRRAHAERRLTLDHVSPFRAFSDAILTSVVNSLSSSSESAQAHRETEPLSFNLRILQHDEGILPKRLWRDRRRSEINYGDREHATQQVDLVHSEDSISVSESY